MYREQLQATRFFTINTSHELMKHTMIEDDHFHFDYINSCLPKRVNNNLNRIRTGPNYMALLWQGRWGGSGLYLVHMDGHVLTTAHTHAYVLDAKGTQNGLTMLLFFFKALSNGDLRALSRNGQQQKPQWHQHTARTMWHITHKTEHDGSFASMLQHCCGGASKRKLWHPKDSIIDHLGPRWFTVNTNRGGGISA